MNNFNPADALQPKNRRRSGRSRAIKFGKLVYGDFSPTILDCRVIEISDQGARVETSVMTQVPDLLLLQLSDAVEHRCIVRWAIGQQIGLEFLPEKE